MQTMNLYEFIDLVSADDGPLPGHIHGAPVAPRLPHAGLHSVRTKDGQWIQMANTVQRLFVAMMHDIGLGHIFEDPRFEKAPVLPRGPEELRMIMLARFRSRPWTSGWTWSSTRPGTWRAEPYRTSEQGMTHPQMIHNGHVRTWMTRSSE